MLRTMRKVLAPPVFKPRACRALAYDRNGTRRDPRIAKLAPVGFDEVNMESGSTLAEELGGIGISPVELPVDLLADRVAAGADRRPDRAD